MADTAWTSTPADDNEVMVTELNWEAEGVVAVTLRGIDGAVLPPWRPGAHVDLVLPNGMRRQYSLCGDDRGDGTTYRVAVDRVADTRGGSEYVHLFLRPGQRLHVGTPRNHFALDPTETWWLFLAGGIGITPFLPMIDQAAASGVPWRLHYVGRSDDRMAFVGQVERHGRATVHRTCHGERPDVAALVAALPSGAGVYACGPERLLAACEQVMSNRDDLVLHVERFRPRARELPEPRPFTLIAQRSGVEVTVPAERSALQSLEGRGVRIASGCRTGLCGACEVAVVEGAVEHRDDVLTDRQRATGRIMLACVSRAAETTLVIDA